jgi:BirA family biotin operon repressor/biotin-[acetyl-CoA-carboxylase] ligase
MTELSFDLLRRLGDGEFHSGAALARTLGVSRGTIWNAVRSIVEAGVDVYSVPGRGYRLAAPLSLLDRDEIARHAGSHSGRYSIRLVNVIDSTSTLLGKLAAGGAPSGTVIAAELQQSGRGRLGRVWHAGLGESLTCSLLWRFAQGASALSGLSLAAGVAVVRALAQLGARDIALKWPNDVLWRGRKLAGLLIELQGDALGPSAVVIGIGVNVRLSERTRARIDQSAADVESACGRPVDRNALFGALLAHFASVLDTFSVSGFVSLREEWERCHAHQGRRVAVTLPGGRVEQGIARGVAEDGALLFQGASTVRRLHSAEISLRESLVATAE